LSTNIVDVLVFVSVIPVIPVIATWFLPWELWIPRKIPKSIIGPYLLYCSFAAWHFNGGFWVVGIVAFLGIVVSVSAAFDLRKARSLQRAQDWPVVEGSVVHIDERREEYGLNTVTITYVYAVRGERYAGNASLPFRQAEEAERFKATCAEGVVRVHYRPDNPEVSAPHLQRAR
jgi:hypothetical protein